MSKVLCIFSKAKDFEHPERHPAPVTFFGYDRLQKESTFKVARLEIDRKPGAWWVVTHPLWMLWRPFEIWFYQLTGLGFSLGQLLQHIRYINSFDIVYGINDTSGLPLALLKRIGLIRPRIIFISAGLINNLHDRPSDIRSRFITWFLPAADRVLAWSPLERDMFRALSISTEFIPLEADTEFFIPDRNVAKEDYVLFSGRDIGRDTRSLITALNTHSVPAVFVTSKHLLPADLPLPKSVTLITERISHDRLKELYHRANFVIVPVHEISRISGQTALLEALAMGKAIIAARTKAFVSTYPDLRHEEHLLWYEPENAADLANQISRLQTDLSLVQHLEQNARIFAESLPRDWFYTKLRAFIDPTLA